MEEQRSRKSEGILFKLFSVLFLLISLGVVFVSYLIVGFASLVGFETFV